MVNKMVPVIEWISNCIELERNSNSATISLGVSYMNLVKLEEILVVNCHLSLKMRHH